MEVPNVWINATQDKSEFGTALTKNMPGVQFNLQRFVNNLQPPSLGLLPAVTRWIHPNNDMIVIERAPTRQSISYMQTMMHAALSGMYEKRRVQTEISLPWQIYVCTSEANAWFGNKPTVAMFVHNEPLKSLDDKVGMFPLPNLRNDGTMCLPHDMRIDKKRPLGWVAINAIAAGWSSGFNENVPEWYRFHCPLNMAVPRNGTDMIKTLEEIPLTEIVKLDWRGQDSLMTKIKQIRRVTKIDDVSNAKRSLSKDLNNARHA